ncbi:MAG: ImpA family type VI secretion system protein [Mariniblastus sp.]
MSDEEQLASGEVEESLPNDTEGAVEESLPEDSTDDQVEESTPDESTEETETSEAPSFSNEPIEANFEDEELNEFIRVSVAPISDQHPCGESEDAASSVVSQIETSGDAIHEALRVSFGEAVRDDNMNMFDMASTGRDAAELVEQITQCLGQNCKSLVLASYLPHLMLIGHGLSGFSAGLDIFRELVMRYGDLLYPQDREKILNFLRRGVYVGNDDKVTDNYKLFLYLPITEHNSLPYALLRNSRLKGSNPESDGRYASGAASSSPEFYVKLIAEIEQVAESARAANAALADLLGDPMFEIVSFGFIESVERMGSIVENLATENCGGYPPIMIEEEAAPAVAGAAPVAAATGEITTREQAIEQLRRIADFFHRTERHSPVSYRIRETIRWCKMDLPELLQELLSGDEGPLEEMGKRVGFRAMEQEDE